MKRDVNPIYLLTNGGGSGCIHGGGSGGISRDGDGFAIGGGPGD